MKDLIPPYSLETYSGRNSRYSCPACGKRKIFVRYVDNSTGEHLGDHVGRCNRESSCGYHYPPKQFFDDNGIKPNISKFQDRKPQKVIPYGVIPTEVMESSLQAYSTNRLYRFLSRRFDPATAEEMLLEYKVGTSRLFGGGTIYWRVDYNGVVRSGQIMAYDPVSGRRIKRCNTWVHSAMDLGDFRLKQMLFGEHLLSAYPQKRVAVVESQKSALICSRVFQDLLWVATCGKGNFNRTACSRLAGREVVVIPDTDAYEDWLEKAGGMKDLCFSIEVDTSLMDMATEDEILDGYDIVDYLDINPDGKYVIQ